jgi:Leucine-rich repeat (LRR) protein
MLDYSIFFSPSTKTLDLNGRIPYNQPIFHFPDIEEIHIENNYLDYLPPFPPTVKRIYCSNNNLKSLPPLPANLEYLDCSNNPELKTLPYYNSNSTIIVADNTGINLDICDGMNPLLYELTKNNR